MCSTFKSGEVGLWAESGVPHATGPAAATTAATAAAAAAAAAAQLLQIHTYTLNRELTNI